MGCLIRLLGALAVIVLVAIAVRHLTEQEARLPPPGVGELDTVVDGVRWRSREAPGSKPETVVYVHGLLSSSASWKRALAAGPAGWRGIAVDLPGFGFSDRPWPYDYSAGAQALHLWRYLDARGIGRVALVGNSLGGAVALIAAAAHPERVEALVLVDSAWPGVRVPIQFRVMRAPAAGELEMELFCRPAMAWMLRYRLFAHADRVTEETISDWWNPVPVPGTRRAALEAIRSSALGYEDAVGRVTAPALVLWGAEDRILPSSEGLRLSQQIRDARFMTLPGAGHVPQEETPIPFTDALASFLAGVGSTGRSAR